MELKKGYKQTEAGLIPLDWEVKTIGGTLKIRHGKDQKRVQSENGIYPILGTGGLMGYANCFLYDKESVLIGRKGTINKPKFINIPFWSVDTLFYSEVNSGYIVKYIYYNFLMINWYSYNEASGVPSLNAKTIENILLALPPDKSEQIKIANVLSDVDSLIDSLEKLIEKKKNIKQGAMQQLLKPKKGWVIKKVQDIAQIGRGRVISHKEIASSLENTFPVYSSQTTNNGIMGYIGSYDFDGEYITWTTDGENAGTVFYRNGKFNCTNVCGTIKLKSENARFIAYLLNSITSFYVSRNLANPKLMNDVMKKIEISIPEIKEQERISNIIFDLELELNTLINQLIKYKNIKQGMMQNLLTGKIRLV